MKILAVSDIVVGQLTATEIPKRFQDVDLVLSCGDLPLDYLEFLVSRIGPGTLFYVNGNHVQRNVLQADGSRRNEPAGCINLHRRIVNYKGLLLAGLEGSMVYNQGMYQYSELQMALMAQPLLPALTLNRLRYGRAVDIFVTHAPPKGIHDQPDRCHQGFEVYLRMIRRYRPRYWLHGHIHLYRQDTVRRTMLLDTEILNVYGYQLIEIDDVLLASSRRKRRAIALTGRGAGNDLPFHLNEPWG